MKAKNNKTGEIVTDFDISKEFGTVSYINKNGKLRVSMLSDNEWTIIDTEDDTWWELFRKETAKEILTNLLSNNDYFVNTSDEDIINYSIRFADKFIKQLKQKQ